MNDTDQNSDSLRNSLDPVTAIATGDFRMVTETTLVGHTWEYNREVYELWRIFDPWPDGMLLHVGGPRGRDVVVFSVWRDSNAESEYMGKIGIERYTDAAGELVNRGLEPPSDLLPDNREIVSVTLGPLARYFFDIGADLDESSGRQFGVPLAALEIDYGALERSEVEQRCRAAGLGEALPGALIVRIVHRAGEGLRELQVWASQGVAEQYLEQVFRPQIAAGDRVETSSFEIKRLAISSAQIAAASP